MPEKLHLIYLDVDFQRMQDSKAAVAFYKAIQKCMPSFYFLLNFFLCNV